MEDGSADAKVIEEAQELIAAHKADCLWFLGSDALPSDGPSIIRLLRKIELHADRATYQKARRLRECLSRNSSAASAGS
jgi:hypothetical protein